MFAEVRYVELNPVRARLVHRPADWPWSSARAHLDGRDDELVRVTPMLHRVGDWQTYLDVGLSDEEAERIRYGERTGRPLGSDAFVEKLKKTLNRRLRRNKPGPQPRKRRDESEPGPSGEPN